MTITQLKAMFNKILQEVKNPVNKRAISKYSDFNYPEFQSTIEKYIRNTEIIYGASKEDKKSIIDKASLLLHFYENNTVTENIKDFFDAAIFLTTHNPEDYPEHYIDNAIQKKVFDERYEKLVSQLNNKDNNFSTLTLQTKDTQTPFKLFKNKNNSIVVKAGKGISPMSVSKNKLKRVLYNNEDYTYKSYEEVIIDKLVDNSIFDLIEDSNPIAETQNNTAYVPPSNKENENEIKIKKIEDDRLKLAGKVSDLEDSLGLYKKDFDSLNILYEQSKNVEKEFQNAKESALKDITLQLSYKFWEDQSTSYYKKYWWYLLATFILSVILLFGVYDLLEDNPFNKNTVVTHSKQYVHKTDSNKTNLVIQKNSQQLTNTDGTDLDKMMEFLHYGFLILLSSMFIWFIRIVMKITLSNYHLSIDANERVIMIRTYLALIKEGTGYDEKDKKVILDNIFRPTNFGIIKDESSVTVTDIISSIKK